jgi:hypothetical protein
MKVTNHSRGPRTFNRRVGENQVDQIVVLSGQTSPDFEPVDAEDVVTAALFESGEISIDGKRAKSLGDFDKLAADRVEHDKRLAELKAREAELLAKETELRSQQDRFQQLQREAAMAAGNTPGLADPLPPGTDTKGGKESEEALRRAGVDPKVAQQASPSEGGADAKARQEAHARAEAHEQQKAKQAQSTPQGQQKK